MKIITTSMLLAALIACGSDKDENKAPPTEPAAAMTAGDAGEAAAPAPTEPAADEIPTATDYEQEVNEAITDDNLEKELEEIEEEVGE